MSHPDGTSFPQLRLAVLDTADELLGAYRAFTVKFTHSDDVERHRLWNDICSAAMNFWRAVDDLATQYPATPGVSLMLDLANANLDVLQQTGRGGIDKFFPAAGGFSMLQVGSFILGTCQEHLGLPLLPGYKGAPR